LYGVTLKQTDLPERIPYARAPQKSPVVLGADEVVRFLKAVPSLKARAALTTAYAAGLRASEAASLKVANIDSSRMVIRIEQGKGSRDRLRQRNILHEGGLPSLGIQRADGARDGRVNHCTWLASIRATLFLGSPPGSDAISASV
jgi:hypothetical protein